MVFALLVLPGRLEADSQPDTQPRYALDVRDTIPNADGKQSQFDPAATDPLTGRRGAIVHKPGALAKKDLNNFQPEVGVAWNFSDKWVFRGNFGVITSDLLTSTLHNNFEEYLATANVQAPPGDPRPVFCLSQGPPAFTFTTNPDGSVPFIGTNYGSRNATWLDPNMRMPYVMNWSADSSTSSQERGWRSCFIRGRPALGF